tara:strand:+ start:422 stop:922 length:501 start_codon:yes stop_codon:yes gene_type:complete
MENKLSNRNYSHIAKFFHWGFVILFIYGLIKQVQDIEQLENPSLLRFEVLFASVFVTLLLVRFIYMKSTQKTSLPENTPKLQKIAAKIVHYGMYFTLAAIPLSGMLIGLLFWIGLQEGFIIESVVTLHEVFIDLIYILIGIHISAAIFHRYKRDGVWSSMVPFFKE